MILVVVRQSFMCHLAFCAGECPLCLPLSAPSFAGVAVLVFEAGAFDLSTTVGSGCATE